MNVAFRILSDVLEASLTPQHGVQSAARRDVVIITACSFIYEVSSHMYLIDWHPMTGGD
jgi:hypothetical protein